jgi:hypothetical protein
VRARGIKCDLKKVSSSNCMGKSKFHVFAENLRIYPSLKNILKRRIQLYKCTIKLLYIFRVEKFSLEFEEDTGKL